MPFPLCRVGTAVRASQHSPRMVGRPRARSAGGNASARYAAGDWQYVPYSFPTTVAISHHMRGVFRHRNKFFHGFGGPKWEHKVSAGFFPQEAQKQNPFWACLLALVAAGGPWRPRTCRHTSQSPPLSSRGLLKALGRPFSLRMAASRLGELPQELLVTRQLFLPITAPTQTLARSPWKPGQAVSPSTCPRRGHESC